MDVKHFNELIEVSQGICDQASGRIANYCAQKYCAVGNDTTEQQLRDYLFIAEESSAFILGNCLALLTPESREKEIDIFIQNLRRVIDIQMKNISRERSESCPGGAFAEGENEVSESIEASSGLKRQRCPLRRLRLRSAG